MTRSSLSRRLLGGAGAIALIVGLAACGSEDSSRDALTEGGGADAVSISGDFGKSVEYKWDDQVTVEETTTEVPIEGDGEKVKDGQTVLTHLSIANGYDKMEVYSTFGQNAEQFQVGADLIPALNGALDDQTLGSRIIIIAPPEDAFGEQGNPQLGIGNGDSVIFVLDLMSVLPDGPSGKKVTPEPWMPKVVEKKGDPVSLDFAGTPKPTDELQVGYLIRGKGKPAAKGDTIYVNYLGQVYGGKKKFDDSYSRGQAFAVTLGEGGVVKGWEQGLEGVPVGSRVILAIPPELGYGKKGSGDIKGTDTMYFVIDVLAKA